MTILLEQYTLPEQGMVELDIHRTFEIKVTAEQARRQVNRWLFTEVGNMLRAESSSLVVSEKIVWRVPVVLTATHTGRVGVVGEIDVDVKTGEMNNTSERIMEIEQRSVALGKQFPPYTPRTDLPAEYIAKSIQPTHSKPILDPVFIQKVTAALMAEENTHPL